MPETPAKPALPPYQEEPPPCPKCGHTFFSTRFMTVGACCHNTEPDGDSMVVYTGWSEPTPRLCRSCGRCGYAWDEAPLDAATVGAGAT